MQGILGGGGSNLKNPETFKLSNIKKNEFRLS